MSITDELLRNNEAYAANFDKGDLPMPPGKKLAVVACMDARLNVYGILGLEEGQAHVIRNAGGVVTDDRLGAVAPAVDEGSRIFDLDPWLPVVRSGHWALECP